MLHAQHLDAAAKERGRERKDQNKILISILCFSGARTCPRRRRRRRRRDPRRRRRRRAAGMIVRSFSRCRPAHTHTARSRDADDKREQ